jgi:hypothetical protein
MLKGMENKTLLITLMSIAAFAVGWVGDKVVP